MAKNSTKDLTNGSPIKLIIGFVLPMLLGLLFQQFYNLADTIIVGNTLGVDALAGVGSTGSINFMIIGFCIGVSNGFAIPVAQQYGAGDYSSLRRYVTNGVKTAAAIAIVMTVAATVLCRTILGWMNTPSDIIDYAYTYIFIIFLGIPVVYLYNFTSAIIRALGDSRTPVYFLILSSVVNIGLDFLFIMVFKLGVAGPAMATVISQAISGMLCLVLIHKKFEILHIQRDEWRTNRVYIRKLLGMGLPMGFQYSITAIGSVILQSSVNSLGSTAVASMTMGSKVSMFFCCPFDALGSTMATFAGQNVGAKKLDRVSKGLISASAIGVVYSVIAAVIMYFFGENLAKLFMDSGEVGEQALALSQARTFLVINSLFYIPLTFVNVVRFTIQGMGYSALAILAGVCEMFARAFVGFVFVPRFGFTVACFASPLAWIMADMFLIPAFIVCKKKLSRILE